jgi:hypothetical protein
MSTSSDLSSSVAARSASMRPRARCLDLLSPCIGRNGVGQALLERVQLPSLESEEALALAQGGVYVGFGERARARGQLLDELALVGKDPGALL